jgi:alkylation response protein AidB-like acyl-CoA dehydrogenase
LITEAGRRDIFAAGTDTNIAGQGIPRGLARKVDGGYMIKGDWSYGSGIYHSNWIHSGCILMEDGKPVMDDHGGPTVIITYVPRSAIDLQDNWDVLGLRGTGSFDYSIAEERFVADDLTYVYSKNTVERGGNHYSLGIVGFTSWGHTSFALGVGRHALNEVSAIAKGKAGPFGVLADSASFQEKYARAEAQYRAARAFVYSAWNDLDESLLNEELPTNEQLALIKLAFRYSHEVMSDVCTFAYNFGGGIALRASPLQRCYRDMHAGLQHILLSDQIMQDCGKVLMDHVPEGARMQLLGLH